MPENNVLRCIFARTSIRTYREDGVPKDALEIMLKAAMSAPSARNTRPWCFVVVTDRTILDRLTDALPKGSSLRKAPVAIMVGADIPAKHDNPGYDFWMQDCSAATMNLLLGAEAQGLGTVWIGVAPRKKQMADVATILSLPATVRPLCMVAVGYPAPPPSAQGKV
ncbi:MAG: nitroreductase family protein, partial [Planctomycetaceae bacterium]|nr:nitroreductase family protein [Planctomycetaceae bacterium]